MNADPIRNFVGTWRLVSFEARTSSGEARYPLGHDVVGQLFYDSRGNMSGHVMRLDRLAFASNDPGSGTDAEVRAAFEGHVSYFGSYTVDPTAGTVTHHVRGASYPNWIGHDQIRYYRIDGPHLVLSTPPIVRSWRGAGVHSHLGTNVNAKACAADHRLVACSGASGQATLGRTDIGALRLCISQL